MPSALQMWGFATSSILGVFQRVGWTNDLNKTFLAQIGMDVFKQISDQKIELHSVEHIHPTLNSLH